MGNLRRSVRYCKGVFAFIFVFQLLLFGGCGPPTSSSAKRVKEFEKAGPTASKVDVDVVTGSKNHTGPYRVVPGDILEFQMPTVLRVTSADLSEWLRPAYGHKDIEPYWVRVNEAGTITLPIVGEIYVAGKTLAEIESSAIDAYFPKYVVNPPMVVCEVKKYQRENERVFTVAGLVNHPATFPYPPDVHYNLMEALAFAGGLDITADPHRLKIYRRDANGKVIYATFKVNEKSLVDAYDVRIKPGDVIYVEHTLRTRLNKFLSDIFRVTVGADTRYTSY